MLEVITTTENIRYKCARTVNGAGIKHWQFIIFISDAKLFAFKNGLGVSEIEGLRKYYSEPQLVIYNHDLFDEACILFTQLKMTPPQQCGLW